MRNYRLGALVFLAAFAGPMGRPSQPPLVRVGLLRGQETIRLQAPAPMRFSATYSGKVIAAAPAGEVWTIRFAPSRRDLEIVRPDGGVAAASSRPVVAQAADDAPITLFGPSAHWDKRPDRSYRGRLEIRPDRTGGLEAVNVVDVETYLRGVVPSEMRADFPREALKTQAVAARTATMMFAGRHRSDGFDLCNTEHCQVYGGATSEGPVADRAVQETRGQALTYQGRLAKTYYSAICGGHTESNHAIWGDDELPYLRGVSDLPEDSKYRFPLSEEALGQFLREWPAANCLRPGGYDLRRFRWWEVWTREGVEKKLAAVGSMGELKDLEVTARGISGRALALRATGTAGTLVLRGDGTLRRVLGVRSSQFVLRLFRDERGAPVAVAIWGGGWGHGVGLCQMGAVGLARDGWEYGAILQKYYPGTTLRAEY